MPSTPKTPRLDLSSIKSFNKNKKEEFNDMTPRDNYNDNSTTSISGDVEQQPPEAG